LIKYAGMFEVSVDGCDGEALCVNTDEVQVISDALANEGFKGMAFDLDHHIRIFNAAPDAERIEANKVWLEETIVTLKAKSGE
jgi:hypothetical protein